MDQLEQKLAELFGKLPPLPANIKEFIVKVAPWVDLVLLIILLPAILFIFGLGTLLLPFGFLGGLGAGTLGIIAFGLSAVNIVLYAIAIPGLLKRQRRGWVLNYYAALIGAVQDLLSRDLFGLIIGTGISLYILFQIRSYYSPAPNK